MAESGSSSGGKVRGGNSGGPLWSALVIVILCIGSAFAPGFEEWGNQVLLVGGILLVFLGLFALVRGYPIGGLSAIAVGVLLLPFLCDALPRLVRAEGPTQIQNVSNPLLERIRPLLWPDEEDVPSAIPVEPIPMPQRSQPGQLY